MHRKNVTYPGYGDAPYPRPYPGYRIRYGARRALDMGTHILDMGGIWPYPGYAYPGYGSHIRRYGAHILDMEGYGHILDIHLQDMQHFSDISSMGGGINF